MNKKILIIILTFVLITTGTYYKPITSHATVTTSVTLGSAAAAKVLLALLALAGISVSASDVEFIWDNGGLNTEALVNNMMLYSRELGMKMRDILTLGVAGSTTLIMQRNTWNLFKGWAREKYGTDETVKTELSVVTKEIDPIPSGKLFQNDFIINEQIGWINFLPTSECLVFTKETIENGKINPWMYYIYFVPTEYMNDVSSLVSYTAEGYQALAATDTFLLNNDLGMGRRYRIGNTTSELISAHNFNQSVYDITYIGTGSYIDEISRLVQLYRQGNSLNVTETIEASPITGVDHEAATTVGQDIVSYDTVATQEDQDVILEGPLAVALPDAETLEVLLRQLAEDEITYEDYVRALGLAAVKTKDTTVADVQEKEQAITTNPIAGVYTVSLDDLFPFCIPFDLYDILNAFNADPVAPEVNISLPVGYDGSDFTWEDYTISLSAFDSVAEVARIFEYVLFIIGIMLLTRKLIEG